MAPLAGLRWVKVPLLFEIKTNLFLGLSSPGLPVQIEDLADRPQIIFGIPMAVQAPTHRERLFLVDNVHVVHLTVAAHAADAAIDVHRVIEIRKIGYLMNFYPVNRVPALPTFPDGGQFGVI